MGSRPQPGGFSSCHIARHSSSLSFMALPLTALTVPTPVNHAHLLSRVSTGGDVRGKNGVIVEPSGLGSPGGRFADGAHQIPRVVHWITGGVTSGTHSGTSPAAI